MSSSEVPAFSRRIARPKASQEIIAALRHEIASGRLVHGTRLPNERDLARQFSVSQPTVREAMRALDAMGLVDIRHGSGAYVASNVDVWISNSLEMLLQIERVGILNVLEIRGVLGSYSARCAVKVAQEKDLHAIKSALDSITFQKSVPGLAEAVVAFQLAYAAASHDPLLLALESFLIRLIMKFQLVAFADVGMDFWLKWTSAPHRDRVRMLEQLSKRNEAGTVKAISEYLGDQREAFTSDPKLSALQMSEVDWVRKVGELRLEPPVA